MKRVVIVGGVAGGATAAARMTRLNNKTNITVLERGLDVSFANCGLPYHVGGEIPKREALLLHTPESLQKSIGVSSVRTQMDVQRVDRAGKFVEAKNLKTGAVESVPYDILVLSPGASPIVPNVPGIADKRILTLRNMQDMDKIKALVTDPACKRVAVIGAGFIGLEVAEQLLHLKKSVTIIEKSTTVLPQADPEMSSMLHGTIREHGIDLKVNDGFTGFATAANGAIQINMESGSAVEVDAVVLSIGVRADSYLAKEAGLELSDRGLIVVDDYMRTKDASIYAVGDAVETSDAVFRDRRAWAPLGNVANMQARICADHALLGKSVPYRGSLGTAIVRVFDTALAVTGWNEKRLKAAGIPYGVSIVNAWDHASYYPGAERVTVKMTYCPDTGRIFGGQVAGKAGVDKRADVLATAILGNLTIEDLAMGQFAYSPPFGSAKDPINLVALNARNIKEGLLNAARRVDADRTLIDVRPAAAFASDPVPKGCPTQKVENIFFADMHAKAATLDKSVKYQSMCLWGRTSYFAHRAMRQAGVDCTSVQGGSVTAKADAEHDQCCAPVKGSSKL